MSRREIPWQLVKARLSPSLRPWRFDLSAKQPPIRKAKGGER